MKPSWLYKLNSKVQPQNDMNVYNRAQQLLHEGSPEGFLRAVSRARPATKKADLAEIIVSV